MENQAKYVLIKEVNFRIILSIHNEGISVTAERFIRALKSRNT